MAHVIKKEDAIAALELLGFGTDYARQPMSRIYFSKMLTETVRLEVEFTMLEQKADGFYFSHHRWSATHFRITEDTSKWSSLFGKGCRSSKMWDERDRLYEELLALCGIVPEPEPETRLLIID